MKKLLIILFIISLSISAFIVFKNSSPTSSDVPLPQTENLETSPAFDAEDSSPGQKLVAQFLQNIAEKKIPEAISMMTVEAVPNEETKQTWGVHFAAFKKLTVVTIEPSMKETWTDTKESYKATLDVEMEESSANSPVPYFGYEKGENIRWINVEKVGEEWKIAVLSTGP